MTSGQAYQVSTYSGNELASCIDGSMQGYRWQLRRNLARFS